MFLHHICIWVWFFYTIIIVSTSTVCVPCSDNPRPFTKLVNIVIINASTLLVLPLLLLMDVFGCALKIEHSLPWVIVVSVLFNLLWLANVDRENCISKFKIELDSWVYADVHLDIVIYRCGMFIILISWLKVIDIVGDFILTH